MRHNHYLSRAAWWAALLLGQASLLFGMMVALGWTLAFALILPQKGNAWMAGHASGLPMEPRADRGVFGRRADLQRPVAGAGRPLDPRLLGALTERSIDRRDASRLASIGPLTSRPRPRLAGRRTGRSRRRSRCRSAHGRT